MKSLQEYLSKIKKPSTSHLSFPSKSFSSSTSWILRGCKHPKTPSFSIANRPTDDDNDDHTPKTNDEADSEAATLSDIDRFLFENFKSLYVKDGPKDDQEDMGKRKNKEHVNDQEDNPGRLSFDDSDSFMINPPPDLCSSNRFFVGEPGSSGSLIEEFHTSLSEDTVSSSSCSSAATTSTTLKSSKNKKGETGADDFIAILTYSPSPYDDFKHSMQEMIKARLEHNGKVNWEFMEELLFCYFNLNDKKSYKYILSAFVDLIVVLRKNNVRIPAGSRIRNVRPQQERRKKRETYVT